MEYVSFFFARPPWDYRSNSSSSPLEANSSNNSTLSDGEDGPLSMGLEMATGVVMIAMVSMLQHLAIVKFYSRT